MPGGGKSWLVGVGWEIMRKRVVVDGVGKRVGRRNITAFFLLDPYRCDKVAG